MHKHDMPEAELESLLSWSASFLIQIELFEQLFTSLDPDVRRHIRPDTRVRDIFPAGQESALISAFRAYEQETSREILAFGADIDPQSDRYQWGTPEKNEAAVRSIEHDSPVRRCR